MTILSKLIVILIILLTFFKAAFSQITQNFPELVKVYDTTKYKFIPNSDNASFSCFLADITVMVRKGEQNIPEQGKFLLCIKGHFVNDQKEGKFITYVFDDKNYYKIWEQDYLDNKLNGLWKTYNLSGNLLSELAFKSDSLNGISKEFTMDRKSIISETHFKGSSTTYFRKIYSTSGVLLKEINIVNGELNGISRQYYPNGNLMEEAEYLNNNYHGLRKYYYPNGNLWNEIRFEEGKYWDVISNYNSTGEKRPAGTLEKGNGTIIYYNEDNSIREIANVVTGKKQ